MFLWSIFLITISLGSVWTMDDDDTDTHWETFKEKYNKTYDSPEEENKARDNFEENLLHVALHNMKDEDDFDKNLHQYSDLTEEEQVKTLCGADVPDNVTRRVLEDFSVSERALPDSWDWVDEGLVSSVKDQKSCGSCWAFSTVGAVEGQVAKTTGSIQDLSPQHLVNCDKQNSDCDGGWPIKAYEYVQAKGILKEEDMPYTGEKERCTFESSLERIKISDFASVSPQDDEEALLTALHEKGPISVAIYVGKSMMHYSSGIYVNNWFFGQKSNHAVLLVGYGTEDGVDYWKIKNSWGPDWGESGYIRTRRNYDNHLNIATYATYPIM